MSTLDDLLDTIFESKKPDFYPAFAAWVRGSRRYQAFATTYRDKIRAKLKNARDEGGIHDLRAELETAAVLLHEARFTLEYEKYAASKQRGPDFTVTFRTHTPFNVEVRRIRSLELEDSDAAARMGKLMAVLCDKVGQMPPSIINLLWLSAGDSISEADLSRAAAALRERVERRDDDFFRRRGFLGAADFLRQYHHLSGIALYPSGTPVLWLNPLARHKVPPDVATAIQRLEAP